jgi:Xaa-Pro aminopeptidase
MKWTREQFNDHIKAVKFLEKIKDETFRLIGKNKNVSEYEVSRFVLGRFKFYNIITWQEPIVAFRENTQYVHYFPSQYLKKLKPKILIMLDIWGKLKKKNAPFADLTFVAYYGQTIPVKYKNYFKIVAEARDEAVLFLKNKFREKAVPSGRDVDSAARNLISKNGHGDKFLHGLGHTLGLHNPHGVKNHFNQKNLNKIFLVPAMG